MEASMLLSTMHLFPDWNNRLLEDSYNEASQSQVKLLEDEGRSAVWETCVWFGCETRGVPGLACRLLERYLFTVLHGCLDDNDAREFRRTLQAQIPLLIASCITLASKMNNSASPVVAKVVHIVFLCKRISCSVDEIIASEFKVYSTLGFRIPLWTSVETGEMMAVEVGIPTPLLDSVAMLVDVAEYRRHRINKKVHWAAKGPSSATIGNVLSLHLTAGAVAATIRLFHYTGPDIVPRLAQLTKAPKTYIRCIRDVVCAEIFAEMPQRSERSLKRKRSFTRITLQ